MWEEVVIVVDKKVMSDFRSDPIRTSAGWPNLQLHPTAISLSLLCNSCAVLHPSSPLL